MFLGSCCRRLSGLGTWRNAWPCPCPSCLHPLTGHPAVASQQLSRQSSFRSRLPPVSRESQRGSVVGSPAGSRMGSRAAGIHPFHGVTSHTNFTVYIFSPCNIRNPPRALSIPPKCINSPTQRPTDRREDRTSFCRTIRTRMLPETRPTNRLGRRSITLCWVRRRGTVGIPCTQKSTYWSTYVLLRVHWSSKVVETNWNSMTA